MCYSRRLRQIDVQVGLSASNDRRALQRVVVDPVVALDGLGLSWTSRSGPRGSGPK